MNLQVKCDRKQFSVFLANRMEIAVEGLEQAAKKIIVLLTHE
jgi:hypothetical protein